jgi:hypothetical protein
MLFRVLPAPHRPHYRPPDACLAFEKRLLQWFKAKTVTDGFVLCP